MSRIKNRKISVCKICNKSFEHWAGRNSKYCSKDCWSKRNPPIKNKCEYCNNDFISYNRKQKFCSKKCGDSFWIGKPSRRPKNQITKRCNWCDKEFTRPASYFCKKHSFCCHSCSAKWWSEFGIHGEDHAKWNGGNYICYTNGWKPLRKKALKRANYKCEVCGKVDCRLEVHHKKPVVRCISAEEANRLSNVIVVCSECHVIQEKISRNLYPQLLLKL